MKRADKQIAKLVPTQASVLDLGCGSGDLLAHLRDAKQIKGYGIDIDYSNILSCTKKGLPVYHGDLNEGLKEFKDHSYDVVILSQTMQQIKDPIALLHECIRVGKKVIVTFPNFSHWKIRLQLLMGQIPQTKTLPYTWYNTPNIRVVSIRSFRQVCREQSIPILQEISLFQSEWMDVLPDSFTNLLCQKGMFVLGENADQDSRLATNASSLVNSI